MATVAVLAAAVSACSVSGEPVRPPDLSSKAVSNADFPYGPAQQVPAAQVPGVLADITFRPLRGQNNPANCTPAAVDAGTAQVRVGPGGPAGGTLTALVVRSTDDFHAFVEQAERCASFVLGGTLASQIETKTSDLDASNNTVRLDRMIRMGPESTTTPQTAVTEFVAQQGDVRVYVQNRRTGTAELGADELAATQKLFEAARRSAFS